MITEAIGDSEFTGLVTIEQFHKLTNLEKPSGGGSNMGWRTLSVDEGDHHLFKGT